MGQRAGQRDGVAGTDHDRGHVVGLGALEDEERHAAADAHRLGALAARAADVGDVDASVVTADDHHRLAGERSGPLDRALQEAGVARGGERRNREEERETEGNQ
ncbi:MAG TPA: hypothetical protein VGM22_12315 [Methylomirabilota bacterium]